MIFNHIYGYVKIIETIRIKRGCIVLGGVAIHYDKNEKPCKVVETENVIIRCAL
jgi:hypothetical protein